LVPGLNVNVFIPTTPNPTSGFLLFCPVKDIIHLDMTNEEAVKLVVSGGIVSPPDKAKDAGKAAQKPAAKKTVAKKPAAKKTVAKKPAAKKTVAKKAAKKAG
jgi:uncharacterized membrane protein